MLLTSGVKTGILPSFSSFPGDIAEDIDDERSVFFRDSGDEDDHYDHKLVLQIIKRLTPVQSAIFCFRTIMGYTMEKVGKILGCSHQYVNQQEVALREKLKKSSELKEMVDENN